MNVFDRWVRFGSIVLLASLFLLSAFDKLLHYDGFLTAVGNYVILPTGVAPYVAPIVICTEFLGGFGLLVNGWRRPAAFLISILLLIYAIMLSINKYYNPSAICGCWFSITLGESTLTHIIQNLLLAWLACWIGFENVQNTVSDH